MAKLQKYEPTARNSFQEQCECGLENISRRVINGHEAQQGRYPWMVGLSFVKSSKRPGYTTFGTCGENLITNQHILTAAHCFA